MWTCQCSEHFKFIPHTHTHALLIIPFEDCELRGLKVDIADFFSFGVSCPPPPPPPPPSPSNVKTKILTFCIKLHLLLPRILIMHIKSQ